VPVATRVVKSTWLPRLYQRRLSATLMTMNGLSAAESAAIART